MVKTCTDKVTYFSHMKIVRATSGGEVRILKDVTNYYSNISVKELNLLIIKIQK
jgi:hypothetical protein